ncbi:MAG: transposase [Bacteroidetes bacterium]|nr:transposase [Bacteroidota bacterium]
MQKPFYRQRLPHKQAGNAIYFITYRLYDSIPNTIIQQLREENERAYQQLLKNGQFTTANEYALHQQSFERFDSFLDKNPNAPYWLQQPQIAQIVYDSLLHLSKTEIDLYCFTIMSNHVHALFAMKDDEKEVYRIMQLHKSFTARQCNNALGRSGSFWQEESYDHIVRHGEFENIVNYILQNPVKAGLVKNWEDWKWTYWKA